MAASPSITSGVDALSRARARRASAARIAAAELDAVAEFERSEMAERERRELAGLAAAEAEQRSSHDAFWGRDAETAARARMELEDAASAYVEKHWEEMGRASVAAEVERVCVCVCVYVCVCALAVRAVCCSACQSMCPHASEFACVCLHGL